jgi:hypothetical protein
MVQHAGESDYGIVGLTTDPNAVCNPDGTTTGELKLVPVQGGVVQFYTCGASSFIVTPGSGSATITSPISGTVSIYTQPIISGTGSSSGATVVLTNASGTAIGTSTVLSGTWTIVPTS